MAEVAPAQPDVESKKPVYPVLLDEVDLLAAALELNTPTGCGGIR